MAWSVFCWDMAYQYDPAKAVGFTNAVTTYLARGGGMRGNPKSGKAGLRFTEGPMKGKTVEQATEMAKQLWLKASPAIRDKYARQGNALMTPEEIAAAEDERKKKEEEDKRRQDAANGYYGPDVDPQKREWYVDRVARERAAAAAKEAETQQRLASAPAAPPVKRTIKPAAPSGIGTPAEKAKVEQMVKEGASKATASNDVGTQGPGDGTGVRSTDGRPNPGFGSDTSGMGVANIDKSKNSPATSNKPAFPSSVTTTVSRGVGKSTTPVYLSKDKSPESTPPPSPSILGPDTSGFGVGDIDKRKEASAPPTSSAKVLRSPSDSKSGVYLSDKIPDRSNASTSSGQNQYSGPPAVNASDSGNAGTVTSKESPGSGWTMVGANASGKTWLPDTATVAGGMTMGDMNRSAALQTEMNSGPPKAKPVSLADQYAEQHGQLKSEMDSWAKDSDPSGYDSIDERRTQLAKNYNTLMKSPEMKKMELDDPEGHAEFAKKYAVPSMPAKEWGGPKVSGGELFTKQIPSVRPKAA